MVWPWQKKAQQIQTCKHKYKDFPWYCEMEYDTSNEIAEYTIIEPFVCLLCKHRINKVLSTDIEQGSLSFCKRNLDILINKHPQITYKCVVEDMIADMQLVDRDFSKYYDLLHTIDPDVPKLIIKTPSDDQPKSGWLEKEIKSIEDANKSKSTSADQIAQWLLARHGIEPYASHFKNIPGNMVHTIVPIKTT